MLLNRKRKNQCNSSWEWIKNSLNYSYRSSNSLKEENHLTRLQLRHVQCIADRRVVVTNPRKKSQKEIQKRELKIKCLNSKSIQGEELTIWYCPRGPCNVCNATCMIERNAKKIQLHWKGSDGQRIHISRIKNCINGARTISRSRTKKERLRGPREEQWSCCVWGIEGSIIVIGNPGTGLVHMQTNILKSQEASITEATLRANNKLILWEENDNKSPKHPNKTS